MVYSKEISRLFLLIQDATEESYFKTQYLQKNEIGKIAKIVKCSTILREECDGLDEKGVL